MTILLGTNWHGLVGAAGFLLAGAIAVDVLFLLLFVRAAVRVFCLRGPGYMKAVLRARTRVLDDGVVLPWLWRGERTLYPGNLVPYDRIRRVTWETLNPVKHTKPKLRVEVLLPRDVAARVRRQVFGRKGAAGQDELLSPGTSSAGRFTSILLRTGDAIFAEALVAEARREGVRILSVAAPGDNARRVIVEGPSEERLKELLARLPAARKATLEGLTAGQAARLIRPEEPTPTAAVPPTSDDAASDGSPGGGDGAPDPPDALVHSYLPIEIGDLESFYLAIQARIPQRCKRLDWDWAAKVRESKKEVYRVLGSRKRPGPTRLPR